MRLRYARVEDAPAVEAFTAEVWADRPDVSDYVPDVFEDWIESDGSDRRTFVAEVDGDVAGLCRCVVLSDHEAWAQGLRVDPDYRGRGVATALTRACFDWARDARRVEPDSGDARGGGDSDRANGGGVQGDVDGDAATGDGHGASVCRAMVFSWNGAGLATARAAGFDPATEFRWAHPDPDPDADATVETRRDLSVTHDPDAAWSCWVHSAARDHLRGLGLDPGETWAFSECSRERFHWAADETAAIAVRDGDGTHGVTYRTRVVERSETASGESEDETTDGASDDSGRGRMAEYGAAAWSDLEVARALFAAISRDAAAVGADRTRVVVPETVRHVSDAVVACGEVAEHPDFVLAADLTGG